jgi:hypothetical protein
MDAKFTSNDEVRELLRLHKVSKIDLLDILDIQRNASFLLDGYAVAIRGDSERLFIDEISGVFFYYASKYFDPQLGSFCYLLTNDETTDFKAVRLTHK